MTENTVYIGSPEDPLYMISGDDILSVSGELNCNLICAELPIDYLEFQLRVPDTLPDIPARADIWYYRDNDRIAHHFLEDLQQTGPQAYYLKCISAIGVLDKYERTAQRFSTTFNTVFAYIMRGNGVPFDNDGFSPYSDDELLAKIYGMFRANADIWEMHVAGISPAGTKRECLINLLSAHNLVLRHGANGTYVISHLGSAANPSEIPSDDIYSGGSVDYSQPVDRLEVTLHRQSYSGNEAERIEVFVAPDDGPSVRRQVFWEDICHASTIRGTGGITILKASSGGALIEGTGTITGIPYKKTSWTIWRGADEKNASNVVRISDNQFISPDNGNWVADNMWAYYQAKAKTYSQSIVQNGQKCSYPYRMVSPLGATETVYLEKMQISASNILKATCEFVSGFEPVAPEDSISKSMLLTGSGTWAVPEEVFQKKNPKVQVILIGGGSGGDSGLRGADGSESKTVSKSGQQVYGSIEPTPAGACGMGGRVFSVLLEGADLLQEYSFNCGVGGAGGAPCDDTEASNPGQPGAETTFGVFSSEQGSRENTGVRDLFSSAVYGGRLSNEISAFALNTRSVKGSHASGYFFDFDTKKAAGNTDLCTIVLSDGSIQFPESYSFSGDYGEHRPCTMEGYSGSHMFYGGCGSGAVAKIDGNPGGKAKRSGNTITTGIGGDGPDAPDQEFTPLTFNPTFYGFGGYGGHGGGAGGSAGPVIPGWPGRWKSGKPGVGGKGGRGGVGAPGCILIYY